MVAILTLQQKNLNFGPFSILKVCKFKHQRSCFIRQVRQVEPKFPGTRQWGHQVVREGERRGHMLHVTCHPSQTWDMISCFPVLRGAQQLQLCCCQYVSIIYSLKLYCFRLVPLIYNVKMWALNMQDWLYFFWAYWASWVWAGHEDTDTWHEDTNLCRTCDILTRSLLTIDIIRVSPYTQVQWPVWSMPGSLSL